MQESKEKAPHLTTKEELDALYKNIVNPEKKEEPEAKEKTEE